MNSGRFRLVYSQYLGMFVPVSETTKAHGQKSSGKRMRSRHALAAALFSFSYSVNALSAPDALALPTNGVVTSGLANISSAASAMTVNQATKNAIINWGSFNIGANASVNFIQPGASSATLNRVTGGDISQIFGKLTANGQVYLINPNGILFGRGATVNVNSLVASSLNISDDLFNNGFLSLKNGTAAFGGTTGYVKVEAGAALSSASGGKIMMFAPNIENNGLIQTPDGQTLLAAGQKVYLGASDDSNLRGLLVEVDNGGATTNTNLGTIVAERGNITLAGLAVNQNGRVKATTSLSANGSIRLQAQDTSIPIDGISKRFSSDRSSATNAGTVVLGENSVTEVLLDATDQSGVLDSVTVNKSKVDIMGKNIHLMKNAAIVAPSGDVNLVARVNPSLPTISDANSDALANGSAIYFGAGSLIDVSGVGGGSTAADRAGESAAKVSVASNVVEAELRSNELRDSPLQREGILSKAKVYVDSRLTGVDGNVGTSVADVSGYTTQIKQSLGQRLAEGGNVTVQSEGNIVYSPTASINVSGGKVDYIGGSVLKTRLLASNGKIYDIANAPKDLTYVAKQNVSYTEQGYTQGKNAGSVSFTAPAMVLEGKLKGDTISGLRQRTSLTRPKGATLRIGQNRVDPSQIVSDTNPLFKQTYILHSDLVLDASHVAGDVPAFGETLSKAQQQTLVLGQNFTAPTGFSNLLYYADGQISVKNGTNLNVTPGGTITLNGGGVDLAGNLTVRGGTVDLSASARDSYIGASATYANNATKNVELGASSNINVSGLWTNDRLNPAATDALQLNGGKINISATDKSAFSTIVSVDGGDIILNKGSSLNASGGAWLNSNKIISGGNGGDIALLANGSVKLEGALSADSIAKGGSLSLSSGAVTIGTSPLGTIGETLLNPAFFQSGGFTSYNISSIEGLNLADNTRLAPAALTRVFNSNFSVQQSGTDIANFSHLEMLPATNAQQTRSPTSISLSANDQFLGRLKLGAGSVISTDPGASVSLLGKRQLTVLGSVLAPAGNISMLSGKVGEEKDLVNYSNDQTIWLGANSVLDVSGVVDSYKDARGLRVGKVRDAGNVSIKTSKGAIVAEAGAQVNLNGTHAVIDVKSGNTFMAKDVASKGGNLSLSAPEGVLWDATMSARGGNASVSAGSLSVGLQFRDAETTIAKNAEIGDLAHEFPTGPREIVIKATGSAVPAGLQPDQAIDPIYNGLAYVYADKLQAAGFDSIQLGKSNSIRIAENVNMTTRGAITLDTPDLRVADGVQANLNSSYVGIGSTYVGIGSAQTLSAISPNNSTGVLTVNANYIDLFGQQSLSAAKANFNSTGDIQLRGLLQDLSSIPVGKLLTKGDMAFSAAKIYPSTYSNYTLASSGAGSTISFARSGADTGVPFSALGTLNVEAANINQDGVLRAPFGAINLNASNKLTLGSNSLTSVSAEGKTLPFGFTTNGKDWTFEEGGEAKDNPVFTSLPNKNVNLTAQQIETKTGSKVDISGGGDLSAIEFTVGTGGSKDVLAADGVFAILPSYKAGYMPGNSESYLTKGLKAGDSIYLSGGNGLPAGNYLLLPAHYALLPGGYYVKPVSGTQDFAPQQNVLNKDGSMLVSGNRMQFGGLTADSRSSGFLVASGNVARTQSEFSNALASNFFKPKTDTGAPSGTRLPTDAGRVAINAVTNLTLDGNIIGQHAAGTRGSEVDISSDKIAISGDGSQEAGYLTLSSVKLNAMGAESLMIGGKRTRVAEGTQLELTASNVKLIGGASLTGQEITLAATDNVSMLSGTSLTATGAATKNSDTLIIGNAGAGVSGDGALLRVSTGAQPDLVRKNVSQTKGSLDIQTGAKVSADGSIIVDATSANSVNGDISLAKDGAIRLGAPKISFGTPAAPVDGLLLNNEKLKALGDPSNIQLKSYKTIDFYGATEVGSANLKSLTLESSGLVGYNNAGETVTLTADTVKFANPDSAAFAPAGTLGAGTLQVNAGKKIGLGNGDFSTAGFSNVNLNADQVIGEAKGTLNVAGNLTIDAGRITAAGLSNQTIKASANLETKQHAVTGLAAAPLGGKLTLTADTIAHGGIIDMPSGTVTLKATGAGDSNGNSLVLKSGSQIKAQGSAQMLGAVAGLADAGTINLIAEKGGVLVEKDAVLDVSATGGAGAGKIAINAAGIADIKGTLNSLAAVGNGVGLPKQGSFDLSAGKLVDFSALNAELERGRFNGSRNIHVVQGDLTVADTMTAHNVTLTTDDGDLKVTGTINASGAKGGIVNLNAGQKAADGKGNITLASTAVIDASATTAATESAGSTGDGGKVMLNTATDGDTTPTSGSRITAATDSKINVSGRGLGGDGKVTLRAPRLGIGSNTEAGTGIAVNEFKSTVVGDKASIVAEGVKVYTTSDINTAFISNMNTDNTNFLANTDAIKAGLGVATDARFVVAAGDEVRSAGNITVSSDVDLQSGGPGALTLRAKGNVNVNNNISAGFTNATTTGTLTTGGAWTYRIAAGADTSSADVLATNNAGTGNFTLAANKLIRTGTGDIDIATGGNFTLKSEASAIYTAGELDETTNYTASLGAFTKPSVAASFNKNGGDITLSSKGNINGVSSKQNTGNVSQQLPADWLFRQGRFDSATGLYTKNTSWWTNFGSFKQNIGALGGGDININAGGNIDDLSAVIATNGRVFGSGQIDNVTGIRDAKLVQNGGGDLTVNAGGDISGGLYMVDKGLGKINAGGSLTKNTNGIATAFALGDAAMNVSTLGQLKLMTVFNPTLTGMYKDNFSSTKVATRNNEASAFSTYGVNSAVQLTSVASGVEITNQLATNDLLLGSDNSLVLFPGSLKVVAMNGDFTLDQGATKFGTNNQATLNGFALMPAAKGSLQLAASGSVNLNAAINMSDKDPAQIPSVMQPVSIQDFVGVLKTIVNSGVPLNTNLYHSATILHAGDSEPVEIYAGNDIVGQGTYSLFLPKKANIVAGHDIQNLSVFGQNVNATDVTNISAGNDYNVGGNGVFWGGPGYLDISAGRNTSLGTSDGIVTRGNLDNPFLPEAGANLSLLVGAAAADDKAFIAKYLNPAVSTVYRTALTDFVRKVTANSALGDAEAWDKFQTMDANLQHQFVQTAFFNELNQAGADRNKTSGVNAGSYKRGFDAIATYFPNGNYNGKLDLAFSQLKTERGGDLSVMAPGGGIVIGLPKTPEALLAEKVKTVQKYNKQATSPESILGIFTVKGGDINLFSKGNIDVAQSREFTIAGGDILNWSTFGDIDAGKGSKTASSAPPPLIRTDDKGNTIIDLSGVVSGSGIGTLQTLPNVPAGNVTLIAPNGTVNAGDAGIRSSGNLLVAAQRVLGADNIQVGGASSGVPAVSTANVSFNAPASADSGAAGKQGDQLGAADKLGQTSKLAGLPSVISVEVISLGDESAPAAQPTPPKQCKDDKNKKDCSV